MGAKTKSSRSRVTAKDVAALAGVSRSTVSRVLSDKASPFIGEKTNQRVREVAAQLGYSPDPIARALRGKRTHLLGLIVREIADPFFAKFVAILSAQARDAAYHVVLGHARSDPGEALEMTGMLDTRHCDGVILLGDLKDDETTIQRIFEENSAIVALCRGRAPALIPTINCDNSRGTQMLLDLLHKLGHRRFAFVDAGWLGDVKERRETFTRYLSEQNLENSPERIQVETNDAYGGYRAMRRLLDLSPRPTAVVAATDAMAIGVLKAASDAGSQVPDDLSIVGFDDIDMAHFVSPPLTTIRQPVEEMARQALRMILNLIDGQTIPKERMHIRMMPELVVQQSTGLAPVV